MLVSHRIFLFILEIICQINIIDVKVEIEYSTFRNKKCVVIDGF